MDFANIDLSGGRVPPAAHFFEKKCVKKLPCKKNENVAISSCKTVRILPKPHCYRVASFVCNLYNKRVCKKPTGALVPEVTTLIEDNLWLKSSRFQLTILVKLYPFFGKFFGSTFFPKKVENRVPPRPR